MGLWKASLPYQLKGQQSRIGNTVADGAYVAMMNAIRNDETPNFYFMHYEIAPPHPDLLPRGGEGVRRTVEGEFRTVITPAEEVRTQFRKVKPLGEIKAEERGWTLDVLNAVRRLCEVGTARCAGGSATSHVSGRNVPAALPPGTSQRDVPTNEFTTADVYAFERELEGLHPDNHHARDT